MNVVILQPSYIPWRGYFHQIAKADLFIFYDDVQYDKHGWRNRNRVKTVNGTQWMTIPVLSGGVVENNIPINQVKIDWKRDWNVKHFQTLSQSYAKSPYFKQYKPLLTDFYQRHDEFLADFTIELTIALTRTLGNTHTRFMRSSEIGGITGVKTERLIQILTSLGAKRYISGPSAKDYIDIKQFEAAAISLEYMVYDYPEYPQLFPPYDPQVSILDLLFMVGPKALDYILPGPINAAVSNESHH
jgi:hypothetical protein